MRTLYLNNAGNRWINLDASGNKDKVILQVSDGSTITRTVNYWQSFGNFATCNVSIKGKKRNVFTDTVINVGELS